MAGCTAPFLPVKTRNNYIFRFSPPISPSFDFFFVVVDAAVCCHRRAWFNRLTIELTIFFLQPCLPCHTVYSRSFCTHNHRCIIKIHTNPRIIDLIKCGEKWVRTTLFFVPPSNFYPPACCFRAPDFSSVCRDDDAMRHFSQRANSFSPMHSLIQSCGQHESRRRHHHHITMWID